MAVPTNILQQVITYQESLLAFLINQMPFVATSNTRFKDFNKLTANLGDTVSFDLPPRFTTVNSLVASFESAAQRVQNLTCDQAISTSYAFTAQQFIFNVEDYIEKFGKSAMMEIASKIEANVAEECVTAPFRFYGDGVTPINSFGQLASALAFFRNFGAAKDQTKVYLFDIAQAAIVNSGLNQFTQDRNNEMANSWEVGDFDRASFYASNLLPVHTAGNVGQDGTVLTVTSVTKNASDQVTSITFSGAGVSDADAVKQYDKFQFSDGVSGRTNVRFRTFIGHEVSACPCQFRATADAGSTGGGAVTVSIYPPLQASAGKDQNINTEIVAGMQVTALPSHRAGMINAGNPFFVAMPKLPEQTPYPTSSMVDPDTGIATRFTHGSLFGQNTMGNIHDAIWGKVCVPEYAMSLIFPL